MTRTQSQNKLVLAWLKSGKTINPNQADRLFHCKRLASRIKDLKNLGHTIDKNMVKAPSGARYAEYFLVGGEA